MSLKCVFPISYGLMSRSGHYDLLYKAEDIVQMSVPALANPEIRLLSDNPSFLASLSIPLSHNADLDPLLDIPGFSMGFAPSAFASVAYQSPKEAIAVQKPLSPAPKKKTSPPSASQQPSSPSKALPIQLKIRPHMNQYEFDFEHVAEPKAIIRQE